MSVDPPSAARHGRRRFGRLSGWLRPLRRRLASAALVNEETSLRIEHDQLVVLHLREALALAVAEVTTALTADLATVRAAVTALQTVVDDRLETTARKTAARAELVVSEVMHRAELADARLATDLQRALDILARQQADLAVLHRTLDRVVDVPARRGQRATIRPAEAAGAADQGPAGGSAVPPGAVEPSTAEPTLAPEADGPAPGVRYLLASEALLGGPADRAAHFADLLTLFDRGPVVDLGCGRGEFLEQCLKAGVDGYGIDTDPDAVAAARQTGVRVECADAVAHLRTLADRSLPGVLCSHLVELVAEPYTEALFEQLARTLAVGGYAVVETLRPDSWPALTRLGLYAPAVQRLLPPPRLRQLAQRNGLVVVDTRPENLLGQPDAADDGFPAGGDPTDLAARLDRLEHAVAAVYAPARYSVILQRA